MIEEQKKKHYQPHLGSVCLSHRQKVAPQNATFPKVLGRPKILCSFSIKIIVFLVLIVIETLTKLLTNSV